MLSEAREKAMTNSKQNPYLFIVGCQRSGTGLLRRILNAHPWIAMTYETHWIPRWFEERKGLTAEGFVTPELISLLVESPRFIRMEISREELEGLIKPGEPVSYSNFITGIFDLYGRARGKTLVGDKVPGYVRKIPILHALWPKTRFVHLIRDGRDVCLSFTNWRKTKHINIGRHLTTWNEDPVSTTAMWWEWHVRLGRETGSLLGPELYYEISYESLVANPEKEVKALCVFLGVPYADAMLRFHEGQTTNAPGVGTKYACLPVTPGLRDWKGQMPATDIGQFEAVAGDLLDELGYARGVPCPAPEVRRHAAGIRDLFTEYFRSRKRHQLPKHWEAA
jgi:hypothetical protein